MQRRGPDGVLRSADPGLAADVALGVAWWPQVFRGSAAVRAGLITAGCVRGVRYRRLFPDVYAPAAEPPDLLLRSRAAHLHAVGRGVLAGWSAAALLGADAAPPDTPAEIIGVATRGCPGLVVRRDTVATDEIAQAAGLPVTSALRTAYDLARRLPDPVEAVVALDALAACGRFDPALVLDLALRYPRARGRRRLAELIALADPRAESPMETRLRLLLVHAGLPPPQVQWPVPDPATGRVLRLDLAYPEQRIGVEYDGLVHTERGQVLRDIARATTLLDLGWRNLRFTVRHVYRDPRYVVTTVARALGK